MIYSPSKIDSKLSEVKNDKKHIQKSKLKNMSIKKDLVIMQD
jgi:hypothetical protein